MNWRCAAASLLLCVPSFAAPCTKEPKGFPKLRVAPYASGLNRPVGVYHAGDGKKRLYVVEQGGLVKALENGKVLEKPFLDISAKVRAGGEMGLLGLAFHPKFKENGRFYVNYTTRGERRTIVAEYGPDRKERVLFELPDPYSNHNGGDLAFGPDGRLYVANGDGGSGNDPENRAQDPESYFGKILTFDVDAKEPKPEIFAHGLRNPWRISFDPVTKKLWTGDVGQDDWEEVDVVEKGKNYGWRIMEGAHCTPAFGESCDKKGLTPPVLEYSHAEGYSITGGYVYRGARLPALCGAYVFGDFGSGRVWGARLSPTRRALLAATGLNISSFGVDEDGELYLADYGGGRVMTFVEDK